MVYCHEIEQSNAVCNEIELTIVAKLQNMSWGKQIKKKKGKQKQKNLKILNMILHIKETVIRVRKKH